MLQKSLAIPAALSCLTLTACGSSGENRANVSQINLGTPPVFADGDPITEGNFNNVSFPFRFVEGFSDGPGTELRRGAGTASVSFDGDTLVLEIGDGEFIDLDRVSGAFFETGSGIDFAVEELGVARVVSLNDEDLLGISDIVGIFGFQTPSAFLPTETIRYNSNSYARVILTQDGDDVIGVLENDAAVNLLADFSRGGISGTLFNGTGFVDIDGDNFRDDSLTMFIALENGRISGGTFSGTLSGDAVAFINDEDFVDLNPTLSGTRADGVFFGNNANLIGGTFEGDYRSAGPDGSFVGYFDVGEELR